MVTVAVTVETIVVGTRIVVVRVSVVGTGTMTVCCRVWICVCVFVTSTVLREA